MGSVPERQPAISQTPWTRPANKNVWRKGILFSDGTRTWSVTIETTEPEHVRFADYEWA